MLILTTKAAQKFLNEDQEIFFKKILLKFSEISGPCAV